MGWLNYWAGRTPRSSVLFWLLKITFEAKYLSVVKVDTYMYEGIVFVSSWCKDFTLWPLVGWTEYRAGRRPIGRSRPWQRHSIAGTSRAKDKICRWIINWLNGYKGHLLIVVFSRSIIDQLTYYMVIGHLLIVVVLPHPSGDLLKFSALQKVQHLHV